MILAGAKLHGVELQLAEHAGALGACPGHRRLEAPGGPRATSCPPGPAPRSRGPPPPPARAPGRPPPSGREAPPARRRASSGRCAAASRSPRAGSPRPRRAPSAASSTRLSQPRASERSVPFPSGRKERMSLTSRSTCFLPFRGGITFSTRSMKRSRPTRSLLAMAEKAICAATSAAISRLRASPASRTPPRPRRRPAASTVSSRSSVKTLTYGVAHARGHVPVDGADVVARLVRPHLGEGHPPALEDRVVLARQERRRPPGEW